MKQKLDSDFSFCKCVWEVNNGAGLKLVINGIIVINGYLAGKIDVIECEQP